MTQKTKQSTIKKIQKEWIAKRETYTIKDKIIKEIIKIKHNHLSVPAMHYSQTILLTERADKDTL